MIFLKFFSFCFTLDASTAKKIQSITDSKLSLNAGMLVFELTLLSNINLADLVFFSDITE